LEITDYRLCLAVSACLCRIRTSTPGLIADRKYHLHTYKQCIVGREFVDWLIVQGDVKDREEALEFGKKLVKAGVIRHGKLQTLDMN